MKSGTLLKLLAGWGVLFLVGLLRADDTTPQSLPDGITLMIGGEEVELRVASPHVFRLHVYSPTESGPTHSIFLRDTVWPETPFTVTHAGAVVGIKTSFGELRVDASRGTWSLLDSSGATLADWASLKTGESSPLGLRVGSSPGRPRPLYYGSGNVPVLGALTQKAASSEPGNGSTSLPQYWSNAGYGALLISDADNRPASWRATGGGVVWSVPGTSADLYLAPTASLYEWLRDDAELTGFAPVPPRWAFGYLQSRWGWTDKAYLDETFAHFRADQLPVDAFIVDFEWYTKTPDYEVPAQGDPNFVDFDWNPVLFPNPIRQLADFAQQGLQIVGIRKPRLGNAENLRMARSKGWILPLNPHDPIGDSGARSRNLDFANPEVQVWWQDQNRKFVAAGMAGFWDDEGETTFTEYSYWNTTELGLFQQVKPGARFWSLNRSFCPGLQRFGAAVWTGDIAADWKTLAQTPGELLSYGLSGLPYTACDIGGYYAGLKTPELLVRWMQAGVFFPVMRSHSERKNTPHFPWLAGPVAEAAIRKALDLRYRLIPYYYSLAQESYREGAPLMRPLVMEFPGDEKVAETTDEWLMGRGLLAAPILNAGGARSVYLPSETWFAFGTNQATQGPQMLSVKSQLDEIPIFVRAGTLLPLGPVLQYTGEPTTDPMELQIYPGRDGTFRFVEDDGATLDYQKGAARITTFSWNDETKTLSWKAEGAYRGANLFHGLKAVLFAPAGPVSKLGSLDQDGSINFQ